MYGVGGFGSVKVSPLSDVLQTPLIHYNYSMRESVAVPYLTSASVSLPTSALLTYITVF